jgi:hypothetical protein
MKTSIDLKRLKELEKAEQKLLALEAGGVDNWEWYDEAMTPVLKSQEIEDKIESFLEDLECTLLVGVYEPSERGAGYASTDSAREEALQITINFVKSIQETLNE